MYGPPLYVTKLSACVAKRDEPQIMPDQYLQSVYLVLPKQPQDFIGVVRGLSLPILFNICL